MVSNFEVKLLHVNPISETVFLYEDKLLSFVLSSLLKLFQSDGVFLSISQGGKQLLRLPGSIIARMS